MWEGKKYKHGKYTFANWTVVQQKVQETHDKTHKQAHKHTLTRIVVDAVDSLLVGAGSVPQRKVRSVRSEAPYLDYKRNNNKTLGTKLSGTAK